MTLMPAALAAAAAVAFAAPATAPRAATSAACAPVNGFNFICGMEHPEDLKRLPGTRWIVASSFADRGGLKLVDAEAHTMRRWWAGTVAEIRPDRTRYGSVCPGPPDAALLNTQGLSLRPAADGRSTLYAVNHGGREAIEVFEIDSRPNVPEIAWIGCVPLPPGLAANSTAAFADGAILATVLLHPGFQLADQVRGRITGGVYQWRPGDPGFRLLPGTELPGNNGLETSPDGREFYVVAFGLRTIFAYDRDDTTRPLRQAQAPNFMPDNVAWDPAPSGTGSRLLAAGMVHDEPACGGPRKVIDGVADAMRCPRGYIVAALDPQTMTFTIVDYGEPNPAFNGVSSAIVVGDEIWLGSYQADRLAWRPLPGAAERPRPRD